MGVLLQRDYVDLLDGDVLSALMLSQIVYWYRQDKKSKSKLRVNRFDVFWLAKSNIEWEAEIGLSPAQSRRCLEVLRKRKIIETEVRKFWGTPVNHLRLLYAAGASSLTEVPTEVAFREFCSFVASNNSTGTKGTDPFDVGNESNVMNPPIAFVAGNEPKMPKIPKPFATDSKSLTESTSETTAESTSETSTCLAVPAQAKAAEVFMKNDQGELIGMKKEEELENWKNAKDVTCGSEKKSTVLLPPRILAMDGDSDLPTLEQIEANADRPWQASGCNPYPEVAGVMVELGEYVYP
jgi:hypothetical protein